MVPNDIYTAIFEPEGAPALAWSRRLGEIIGGMGQNPHVRFGGLFEKTGLWACVARSVGGGKLPGPWSAPTATAPVQTGFYRVIGGLRLTDFRGPS
jgi:hypothetical protein